MGLSCTVQLSVCESSEIGSTHWSCSRAMVLSVVEKQALDCRIVLATGRKCACKIGRDLLCRNRVCSFVDGRKQRLTARREQSVMKLVTSGVTT